MRELLFVLIKDKGPHKDPTNELGPQVLWQASVCPAILKQKSSSAGLPQRSSQERPNVSLGPNGGYRSPTASGGNGGRA